MKQLAEELKAVVEAGGKYKGEKLSKVPQGEWIGLTVKAVVDTVSNIARSSKEDRWVKKGSKAKVFQITRGPSYTAVPFVEPIDNKLRKAARERWAKPHNLRFEIDPHDWVVV